MSSCTPSAVTTTACTTDAALCSGWLATAGTVRGEAVFVSSGEILLEKEFALDRGALAMFDLGVFVMVDRGVLVMFDRGV